MKWVARRSARTTSGACRPSTATLLLNDPVTGVPTAILDAGPITAERTAAISGVAIRAWAPPVRRPGAARRDHRRRGPGPSHVPVLGHVLPGVTARSCSTATRPAPRRSPRARGRPTGSRMPPCAPTRAPRSRARTSSSRPRRSCAARAPGDDRRLARARRARRRRWTTRRTARPRSPATPALFVVDHRGQFLANREAGQFDGYPDPAAMIGEALDSTAGAAARAAGSWRPTSARASRTSCSAPRSSPRPRHGASARRSRDDGEARCPSHAPRAPRRTCSSWAPG